MTSSDEGSRYLSYGAGVGSTALICHHLHVIQDGEIEVVFIDHGSDWPHTYEYLEYIKSELKIPITVIYPKIGTIDGKSFNNLYDYLLYKKIASGYHTRLCTKVAKIQTFNRYISRPATVYLGITYDEKHRAKKAKLKYRTDVYPFVDLGISRLDAVNIIKDSGLEVPEKSGCFFCPFQTYDQWQKLFLNHPDLMRKAVDLELAAQKRRAGSHILADRTLKTLYDGWKCQKTLTAFAGSNEASGCGNE